MKQGQTIGCVAVFIAVLLVTQASVSAKHLIAGGGRYSPDNMSQVNVKFQFLGVLRESDMDVPEDPIIDTHIQFTIVIPYPDTSGRYLRLFTSGTELKPFDVVPVPPTSPPPPDRHIITITGKMLSKLVWDVEPDDQHLTEIVDFTVEARDEKAPEPGSEPLPESLTLTLQYRETPQMDTADWLLEILGADLVDCNAGICTLTLEGIMIDGEIESHTAGDA